VTGAGAAGAWLATRARGARAQAGTVALVSLVGAQLGQTLAMAGRSPLVVATSLGAMAALGTTALAAAGLATGAGRGKPSSTGHRGPTSANEVRSTPTRFMGTSS